MKIRTVYKGPTDTQGAKIQARAAGKTLSRPYDHALSADQNHEATAKALAAKLGRCQVCVFPKENLQSARVFSSHGCYSQIDA